MVRGRTKYIHHFWRILTAYQAVYYSDQVALFMSNEPNVEEALEKIEVPKVPQLLEKYKNVFLDAYEHSQGEEFMVFVHRVSIERSRLRSFSRSTRTISAKRRLN
jgi:hypothetical protein